MSTKKAISRRLAEYAEEKGVPEDAFDDDVYTLAGEGALPRLNSTGSEDEQERIIEDFEHEASASNNGGFEEQFRRLLGAYASLEEGEREVRRQIEERTLAP
jgi:hypothetical protein